MSSHEATPATVASSGRGRPMGGIDPPRSLRTTASQAPASPATCDASSRSRDSPTARSWDTSGEGAAPSPSTTRALWQVTQ